MEELKRRHVFRVGIAYLVAGWLVVEVASAVFPTFEAPDWILKVFTTVVALGFPVSLAMGLSRLDEAREAMARAVELGQGADVAVLEKRTLEYSEAPSRKAGIQALFSAIDGA